MVQSGFIDFTHHYRVPESHLLNKMCQYSLTRTGSLSEALRAVQGHRSTVDGETLMFTDCPMITGYWLEYSNYLYIFCAVVLFKMHTV